MSLTGWHGVESVNETLLKTNVWHCAYIHVCVCVCVCVCVPRVDCRSCNRTLALQKSRCQRAKLPVCEKVKKEKRPQEYLGRLAGQNNFISHHSRPRCTQISADWLQSRISSRLTLTSTTSRSCWPCSSSSTASRATESWRAASLNPMRPRAWRCLRLVEVLSLSEFLDELCKTGVLGSRAAHHSVWCLRFVLLVATSSH